jgi:hypothetical protein
MSAVVIYRFRMERALNWKEVTSVIFVVIGNVYNWIRALQFLVDFETLE